MRIAYISGAYIPDRGADSVHVMAMCEALVKAGHEVTLYARAGQEVSHDDYAFYGVAPCFRIEKVARPQVRVWGAIVNGWLAARQARLGAPEVIYARELYGLAFAARAGLPFVYELHWRPKHVIEHALHGWLFRKPSMRRLVFISARLRDLYRAEFPWLSEDKLLVAHDAANALEDGAERCNVGDGSRLQVGYVGGLLAGYGIEVIVELARRHPEYDFHVVGGREPAILDWRGRASGLANLTFHGFVAPSLLGERYRTFDVVLAPYQATARNIDWISPMKLFEYMAHGKAIICADFPVLGEILVDGQDALLVPAADLEAYGHALSRLADPVLRKRLARAAQSKLEREFTWARRAQLVMRGIDGIDPR